MNILRFVTAVAGAIAILFIAMLIGDLVVPSQITIEVEPDMIIIPEIGTSEYEQVNILNNEYQAFHDSLGIDQVYDHDWVETANAIGCSVDELTIERYIRFMSR